MRIPYKYVGVIITRASSSIDPPPSYRYLV